MLKKEAHSQEEDIPKISPELFNDIISDIENSRWEIIDEKMTILVKDPDQTWEEAVRVILP